MSMWTPDAHSLRHVEEYLRSRGMERLVMPAIGSLLVNWQRKTEKGSAIDTSIFVLYIRRVRAASRCARRQAAVKAPLDAEVTEMPRSQCPRTAGKIARADVPAPSTTREGPTTMARKHSPPSLLPGKQST